jgi:hypothetical protein
MNAFQHFGRFCVGATIVTLLFILINLAHQLYLIVVESSYSVVEVGATAVGTVVVMYLCGMWAEGEVV